MWGKVFGGVQAAVCAVTQVGVRRRNAAGKGAVWQGKARRQAVAAKGTRRTAKARRQKGKWAV